MRRVSIWAVLAALAVAGCGDDDDASSETYREDMNALCAESEREINALPQPVGPDQIERSLRQGIDISREYDERFRELEPPEELRARHAEYLRLSREGLQMLDGLADKLAASTPLEKAFEEFGRQLLRYARRSNRLAREMGLEDCVAPLPISGSQPS